MAYPKLNAIAFWMIPPAAALVWLGMADFGWYANPPYSVISAPAPANVDLRTKSAGRFINS